MNRGYLFLGFLFTLLSSCFSQNDVNEKEEFVYKKVDGHEIKATIFLPDIKGQYPVLVYLHGGGFIFGNREEGLNFTIKEKFLAAGFAVISADYRLAPETKLDGIIEDVSDLIEWLWINGNSRFNIDINKICITGGSAGAYLALTTGFEKASAPNAIIAISGPTGFSKNVPPMGDLSVLNSPSPYDVVKGHPVSYGDYSGRMTLWRFLASKGLALYEIFGFDPAKEKEKLDKFKLSANIDSNYPSTLLIHAKNDHLVPLRDAQVFHEFLNEKKVNNKIHIVEYGHSNKLIDRYPEVVDEMIKFSTEGMQK